jgi:hypothetical protein
MPPKIAWQAQIQLLQEIRDELVILRELALVAIRFPDLTDEERSHILRRIQDEYRRGP